MESHGRGSPKPPSGGGSRRTGRGACSQRRLRLRSDLVANQARDARTAEGNRERTDSAERPIRSGGSASARDLGGAMARPKVMQGSERPRSRAAATKVLKERRRRRCKLTEGRGRGQRPASPRVQAGSHWLSLVSARSLVVHGRALASARSAQVPFVLSSIGFTGCMTPIKFAWSGFFCVGRRSAGSCCGSGSAAAAGAGGLVGRGTEQRAGRAVSS